jgi:hypothetical protein
MDGTNMSVSTYPMYGISKPFAALSCSQVLSLFNLSFGSKFLLKNDSVMVLTIEPVSKRQVTIIPAIFNLTVGHLASLLKKLWTSLIFPFHPLVGSLQ